MPLRFREERDRLQLTRTPQRGLRVLFGVLLAACLFGAAAGFWPSVLRFTLTRQNGAVTALQESVRMFGLVTEDRQQFDQVTAVEIQQERRPVANEATVELIVRTADGRATPLRLPEEWERFGYSLREEYRQATAAFLANPAEQRWSLVKTPGEVQFLQSALPAIAIPMLMCLWGLFARSTLIVDQEAVRLRLLWPLPARRVPLSELERVEGGTSQARFGDDRYQFRFLDFHRKGGSRMRFRLYAADVAHAKVEQWAEWIRSAASRTAGFDDL